MYSTGVPQAYAGGGAGGGVGVGAGAPQAVYGPPPTGVMYGPPMTVPQPHGAPAFVRSFDGSNQVPSPPPPFFVLCCAVLLFAQ